MFGDGIMKILILTSINPVIASDAYVKIANAINDEDTTILCYPFFAEIKSQNDNVPFLPTFFAMLKSTLTKKMDAKLFNSPNTIVIGNSYKKHEFDFVLTLNYKEEEVFDPYLETMILDEEFKKFNKLTHIDSLYSTVDAEINLPTIDHAITFIKEAIKKNERNTTKRKTTQGR